MILLLDLCVTLDFPAYDSSDPDYTCIGSFRRSEAFLMMRTLRDMNMSKFVAEDVPLFMSLIDDLFPSVKADRTQFAAVSEALEKVCHILIWLTGDPE
jgi:hypothetical protein